MSVEPSSIRLRQRPRIQAIASGRKTSVSAIVNAVLDAYLEEIDREEEKQKALAREKDKCRSACCIDCDFHDCLSGSASECLWSKTKEVAEALGYCGRACQCARFVPLPAKSLKSE